MSVTKIGVTPVRKVQQTEDWESIARDLANKLHAKNKELKILRSTLTAGVVFQVLVWLGVSIWVYWPR